MAPTSKTKRSLIEVARQLFAKKGVENTTMNDIAEASKRGRRTLYTYFNSKNEIYKAVVESEFQELYKKLDEVIKQKLPADEKIILFAFTRLGAVKEVVRRNGNLRAGFFRDIWRVENVRKEFDLKDIEYLETILKDGCNEEIFRVNDISRTAALLHFSFKGLEVPVIRGVLNLDYRKEEDKALISDLIFRGLYKK
ncbi:MAG: putative HTH-type transcriptional regulator YfiR [Bacteroidetes bacterium ADurb.BinA261]|nr:MAG: putative HTH-type transcriptional regulator YfiR [Bacteroidetes bacterium ADurb.BinA261]